MQSNVAWPLNHSEFTMFVLRLRGVSALGFFWFISTPEKPKK
jgi:hypothetical protein